jgi:hypothetical protein
VMTEMSESRTGEDGLKKETRFRIRRRVFAFYAQLSRGLNSSSSFLRDIEGHKWIC